MQETNELSLRDIYDAVNDLRTEIGNNFVTKAEFLPVKMITFGMVGIIITAVLTVILGNVIVKAFF
jgi:hypothetical protein